MSLHTAGHRRGVVCAPHAAAVEDGRAILAEGGNAIEAMLAMAASIAAVYPHMNHIGGDGFWLIREPSGRVRAIMGAGRAGGQGHAAALPRGRLRRNSDARAARRAHGAGRGGGLDARGRGGESQSAGSCRSTCCYAAAIKHAREGYTVTRSQARLTAEKLPEMKDAAGFAGAFLIDGKVPEVGARIKQTAFAATLDQLAQAGLDDFYRGDVGREIAADLERIGSPVTRADLEKFEARIAEPLSVPIAGRHALQHAAADAGTCLADHPRAVRSSACAGGRKLRAHPRAGRGDQARVPRARPGHHRSRQDQRPIFDHYLSPAFLDADAKRIDRKKGRALAGALWRRRHRSGWARRTRTASSSPTSSRSTGSSAPAACCRRPAS